MISEKYHQVIKKNIKRLKFFANRLWFPPLLILLALLDALIVIIPTDGILISSSMLIKKRWMTFAFCVALGSAIGALILIYLVNHFGLQGILNHYPEVNQSETWKWTQHFFNQYGLIVLFVVGLTPFSQQPALIIAALSSVPIFPLAVVILVSRIIKFCVMAYIATHAPRLLGKLWGVQDELKDAGIEHF